MRQHRIDLAFLDGDILAALIETIDKGDHLVIENVAVAPAFQGHGLGRYLLAHAERLALEQGYGEVRLRNKMFRRTCVSILPSATASTARRPRHSASRSI